MIRRLGPNRLIWIGLALLLTGIILPMLMVMKILTSTFFLNFLSYFISLAGLITGMIGTGLYTAAHRKKKDGDHRS
jgi:hypothetical protein